ncbi:hypothetical protein COO60DRAFT_1568447 [Scenedesmus sp. NREL 46B-D3]|nr:hypothetical protein COO60DRAFT_1568447 [Scenedesmus sp. NREL 46B-D3]
MDQIVVQLCALQLRAVCACGGSVRQQCHAGCCCLCRCRRLPQGAWVSLIAMIKPTQKTELLAASSLPCRN